MSNSYFYHEGGGVSFIDLDNEANTVHSYRDFGLILRRPDVTIPEPQTNFIEIPFRDGSLDLTAPFGEDYVSYKDRYLYIPLTDLDYVRDVGAKFDRLARVIQGKRKKIILDKDPTYYYIGRCTNFSDVEVEGLTGTTTVTFRVDPYRYSIYGANDRWKWDPFNFLTDMAIDAGSYPVNGTLTKVIQVGENDVIPTITVDSDMTLEFEGKTYQLHSGTIRNYDIRLKGGKDNVLVFKGNGTVTIDYRGGRF